MSDWFTSKLKAAENILQKAEFLFSYNFNRVICVTFLVGWLSRTNYASLVCSCLIVLASLIAHGL